MKTLLRQMIGAARMDAETYEQVEADSARTVSAIVVVLLASVAAALGLGSRTVSDIVGITFAAFATWMVWIGLTVVIGKWVMPARETRTGIGEVLRTTGFSAAPGVLRIFAIIPVIGLPIFLVVTIWMLFTFVVAAKHALDFTSFNRAMAVCLLGWVIHGLLFFAFVWVAI